MSTFKVNLSNVNQGRLDIDPSTGLPFETSVQRTISVTGPKRIQRQLKDGETFTDSNYWKRFAYPQVPYDQAFIEVVSDDGSVYSDIASENTFPAVWEPGVAGTLTNGATWTDTNMSLDLVATYGGHAVFVQINNNDSSDADAAKVRLNGLSTAVFTVAAGSSQIFNAGDLSVSKIEFDNTDSGTGGIGPIQVIMSIRSVSNS
ncbi:MAG: hypothetical protein DWQ19_12520 [Crenarchaeota archaeon]|nr:MAG: hypothetical protein DWQ19_12520 [Thermoproteota archaeon]